MVTDRGIIGTISLVPKHWDDYAVSQNVLKLVPRDNNIAGYIYVFLNSEWGKILVKRQTYGSVVDMIDNKSLASVEIPLLKNKVVQTKINDYALKANRKRYEAYLLEREALRILDEEIIFLNEVDKEEDLSTLYDMTDLNAVLKVAENNFNMLKSK